MYEKPGFEQLEITFSLPFGGHLSSDNRWVLLASQIPWAEFEAEYASNFSSGRGAPSLNFRVALGALIIKERQHLSDVETVEAITESPYLQYFLGYRKFLMEPPFDSSMMTHFRKRITPEHLAKLNDRIVKAHLEERYDKKDDSHKPSSGGGSSDTLVLDATCTPADIRFPMDISLLNEAREKSEAILDILWASSSREGDKPRNYRRVARKAYLSIARSKRVPQSKLRKGIRKQLGFLRRNLRTIEQFNAIETLSTNQYHQLLVITEVLRQQQEMYDERKHSVSHRIVSISQPHVRPIVRGKAGKSTEFGAKISASLVDGFAYLDRFSFESYNESEDLRNQVKAHKKRYGRYPKRVLADQIYTTRKNRTFCKERGIELSGKPLGRPPKEGYSDQQKQRWRKNECERVPIEGKFGQLKRRFSLGRVMAKHAKTSETVVGIAFLVANLEKILKDILLPIFWTWMNGILGVRKVGIIQ